MAPSLGLIVVLITSAVSGQTPAPAVGQPTAPGLRKLTSVDQQHARQLAEQLDRAMKDDRWDEAIQKAEELWNLRTRVQGAKHFATVEAEWNYNTVRRLEALPKDDRTAFLAAGSLERQGRELVRRGKDAPAQPFFERALEIKR